MACGFLLIPCAPGPIPGQPAAMRNCHDVDGFPLDDIEQREREHFCQHAADKTTDDAPAMRVLLDQLEAGVDLIDKSGGEVRSNGRVMAFGVVKILPGSGMQVDSHRPIERRASAMTSSVSYVFAVAARTSFARCCASPIQA